MADSSGDRISAPGVCFMIPPPDAEAIALADQYVSPSLPYQTLPLPLQPLPLPSPAPGHGTRAAHRLPPPPRPQSGRTDGGLLPRFLQQSCACSKPQASSRRVPCTLLFAHMIPPGKAGPAQSHPGPPSSGGPLWQGELPIPSSAGRYLPLLSLLSCLVKTLLYPFANMG